MNRSDIMKCPKCHRTDFIQSVGGRHWICVRGDSTISGCGTQFHFVPDTEIRFPHNVIFPNRQIEEFFRKPPLLLNPLQDTI